MMTMRINSSFTLKASSLNYRPVIAFLFILIIQFPLRGFAQEVSSRYSTTITTSAYVAITGGVVLGNATVDDDIFTSGGRYTATYLTDPEGPTAIGIPIGFPFKFGVADVTHFGVNSNGSVYLGASAARRHLLSDEKLYRIGGAYESNIGFDNVIYGFQNDLIAKVGSEIRYQLVGAAPNQELVVQWVGYARRQSSIVVAENINFQIRLRETDNRIQIVFGNVSSVVVNPSTSVWLVGLRGVGGTDIHLIGGAPNALARITDATVVSNYFLINSSSLPSAGQTLTFSRSTTAAEGEVAADISDLEAWPTAMADVLNIRAQVQKADRVNMQLVDLSGRAHLTQSIASAGGMAAAQIDVSSLAPGFYVMQVGTGVTSKHVKLIKQ